MIVCLYEAMCTSRGPQGNQGGATPGKFIMGLRVIRSELLNLIISQNFMLNNKVFTVIEL